MMDNHHPVLPTFADQTFSWFWRYNLKTAGPAEWTRSLQSVESCEIEADDKWIRHPVQSDLASSGKNKISKTPSTSNVLALIAWAVINPRTLLREHRFSGRTSAIEFLIIISSSAFKSWFIFTNNLSNFRQKLLHFSKLEERNQSQLQMHFPLWEVRVVKHLRSQIWDLSLIMLCCFCGKRLSNLKAVNVTFVINVVASRNYQSCSGFDENGPKAKSRNHLPSTPPTELKQNAVKSEIKKLRSR